MKQELLYNKTVDILVQAYFNDTLEHGNYCGCAVGNIIAANCGIDLVKSGGAFSEVHPKKIPDFSYNKDSRHLENPLHNGIWYDFKDKNKALNDVVSKQVQMTGYSWEELLLIERAFEGVWNYTTDDERMFSGLMAVIECLDKIHENNDTAITQTSKLKFTKPEPCVS